MITINNYLREKFTVTRFTVYRKICMDITFKISDRKCWSRIQEIRSKSTWCNCKLERDLRNWNRNWICFWLISMFTKWLKIKWSISHVICPLGWDALLRSWMQFSECSSMPIYHKAINYRNHSHLPQLQTYSPRVKLFDFRF